MARDLGRVVSGLLHHRLIDTKSRIVFGEQILFQCHAVMIGGRRVWALAAEKNPDPVELWVAIGDLLNAAANLSKIFWPAVRNGKRFEAENRTRQERGATLQATYGMSPDSPLALRSMRDNLEHFDERIDKWRRESGGGWIDLHVTRGPAIALPNRLDVARTINLDTMEITFWGVPFDLNGIVAEAKRLNAISRTVQPRGPQWPDNRD